MASRRELEQSTERQRTIGVPGCGRSVGVEGNEISAGRRKGVPAVVGRVGAEENITIATAQRNVVPENVFFTRIERRIK
jgi:hypothetical protein